MIYIFEDGRTLYTDELLTPEDEGLYLSVEALPEIPPVAGKSGYCIADLDAKKIVIKYIDVPELPPEENGDNQNETIEPEQQPMHETLSELKEMQLINLEAQAEIYEQSQENMLTLFQAVAEIYELIGDV